MRLLALDACAAAPSAALADGGEVVGVEVAEAAPGAAEDLPDLAAAAARAAGVKLGSVGLVAVTTGPGGFTGVRVGVATARALALATGARVLPLGVAEVLACDARRRLGRPVPVTVLLEAGRGQVLLQPFAADGTALAAPVMLEADAAAAAVATADAVLAGSAAGRFDAPATARRVEPPSGALAELVARAALEILARGARPLEGSTVRPFYHRPPDARPDAGRALLPGGGA